MTPKVYLLIEGKLQTIHKNVKEAGRYITFVRDTDKAHKNLKGLYCEFYGKEMANGFCNCVFKSI